MFPQHKSRLQDTLALITHEYDTLANELAHCRTQRDKYETAMNAQIQELDTIRQALFVLDQKHTDLTRQYQNDLRRLREEIAASRQRAQLQQQPRDPSPHDHRDKERAQRSIDDRDRDPDSRPAKRTKDAATATPLMGPGANPSLPLPPPPSAHSRRLTAQSSSTNDFLASSVDPSSVPAQFKKEAGDWFVLYNPALPRTLDVNLVHTFKHDTVVCCVQFSADGKWLATGSNRTAKIFDARTGETMCVLVDDAPPNNGDLYIRSVRFSPDGKYLATGAEDKRIRIWDIAKRTIRNVFTGHQQEIYSLQFTSDGSLLVSGSGDCTVRVWDMLDTRRDARTLSVLPRPGTASRAPAPSVPDPGVTCVAVSPNNQYIAAGCIDHLVRIWALDSGQLLDALHGHTDSVYSVAFTQDSAGLVSGSLDNTLKLWEIRKAEGKTVCTADLTGHKDYVLSVAVSTNSQWIVSGSKDRGIQFWDFNGAVECLLVGHKNSVISIALDPVGNLLASGSGDNLARIWSYTNVA